MLTLVMAECEVESIPQKIRNHPLVKSLGSKKNKRPEHMLLDSNLHWRAMRNLDEWERRGRPDILHTSLMVAMESRLNREGKLETLIHTRNDLIIHVNPKTRLPRNYARFCGLLEDLFVKKSIGDLMWTEEKSLEDLLSSFGDICVMEEGGKPYDNRRHGAVVVGGFPHGNFHAPLPYEKFSLFEEPLAAWSVVSEVVVRACL